MLEIYLKAGKPGSYTHTEDEKKLHSFFFLNGTYLNSPPLVFFGGGLVIFLFLIFHI